MTTRISLRDRKLAIASAPWIAYHERSIGRCESTRGSAPLKTYFHKDDEVRRASYEKHRCKNTAHWLCITVNGCIKVVCWPHLASILYSMEEDERWQAWAKVHWPFPRPDNENDEL